VGPNSALPAQAIQEQRDFGFVFRRRIQARRPPKAASNPGRPAPTTGPGATCTSLWIPPTSVRPTVPGVGLGKYTDPAPSRSRKMSGCHHGRLRTSSRWSHPECSLRRSLAVFSANCPVFPVLSVRLTIVGAGPPETGWESPDGKGRPMLDPAGKPTGPATSRLRKISGCHHGRARTSS
jgi:hypothetical protein